MLRVDIQSWMAWLLVNQNMHCTSAAWTAALLLSLRVASPVSHVLSFVHLPLQLPSPPFPALLAGLQGFLLWTLSPGPFAFRLPFGSGQQKTLAGDERMGRKKYLFRCLNSLYTRPQFYSHFLIFLWPQPSCGPSPMVNNCFPISLPD